jgi:hypothetical protein
MSPLPAPSSISRCSAESRSFLRGPDGPAGAAPGHHLRSGGYMAAIGSGPKVKISPFEVSTLPGNPAPPLHRQSPPVRRTAGRRTRPPGPQRPAEPHSAPSPHRFRRPATAPGPPDIPPACHMSPSSPQASTCSPASAPVISAAATIHPTRRTTRARATPCAQHCRRRHARLADRPHHSGGCDLHRLQRGDPRLAAKARRHLIAPGS